MSNLKKVSTNLFRDASTGTYYMIVRRGGKRIKESLGTGDRTLASVRLHDRLANLPDLVAKTDANWADVERLYIETELPTRRLKAASFTDRLGNLANIRRDWPNLATTPVRKIRESDCKGWLGRRLQRPQHGEQRVNNEIDSLKQVLALAVRDGIIARNPAAGLKRFRVPKKELRLPSRAQFAAVVADLRLRRLDDAADLVELLAYSGMRLGEAQALRWEDIDWQRGRFYVSGDEENDGPKNRDQNSRPLFPKLKRLLEAMREQRGGNPPTGLVLRQRGCRKALAAACFRVGCPHLTHHAMRHLFITECMEHGQIHVKIIARWVGHRDGGALILERYGHVRDDAEQQAVELLR
jgi:integrase